MDKTRLSRHTTAEARCHIVGHWPPKLNGLEARRQIRDLVPSAKIVFLTQETDADVVTEAFSLGAWGYVLKQDTESDLLAALASVLEGQRFVSSGLSKHLLVE